ncbi:hypothetical protein PHYBOEH_008945 [Phytophthora boehmeriae]|uniref:Proteasome component ECM29 n=1 Tax=Phytophthora boehmeriae TaxID=109152 RepID=A0A8T1X1H8_9STRA|nr:hypothetical protein PHYBOEH_008945 [Phytophthora boehmeriae]
MTDLQKDIEALDRVLFRLASADDERMLQVLQSLLPQLLRLFPRSLSTSLEVQLKDKILQVISHVKTRLQALNRPALPLAALSEVLQTPELSVFTYNMALLFIELGFDAASSEQQTAVLAGIAKSLAKFSPAQQETFFRLLIRALPMDPSAVFPCRERTEAAGGTEDDDGDESMEPSTDDDEVFSHDGNVEVVFDFLLDLMLYEIPSSSASDVTLYGLMTPRVERLQRVKVSDLKRDALYERQLHAVKFVKEMEVPTKQKIAVYLAGSASFHHAIKAFCEEQLSRVIKYEEVQLQDSDVMRRVMALVLGSQVAQSSGVFEGTDALALSNRTRLADASILQSLTLLGASEAATNVLPLMLQLLCQLMFGTEPSRPPNVANKIKLASVRLCQWTFHHCQPALLHGLLGPVLFPTLLRLLMDPHAESEASNAEFVREFRQGVYEALTLLATRVPTLVTTSEQAFQVLLVRSLVEEEHRTGAGANALKAFTSLAKAYAVAAAPDVLSKVYNELIDLLNGSKLFDSSKTYARVQTAIATWCAELLTTSKAAKNDDITMRFALLRLSGVADEETRRLSTKALLAEPLPSTHALAISLEASFSDKDLKRSMHDTRSAESCVRFCVTILKTSLKTDSQNNFNDRKCVIEYILQTLLGRIEEQKTHDSTSTLIFETTAGALVDVCTIDAEIVGSVLAGRGNELLNAATASQDRGFLSNIAAILTCTCNVGAFSTSQLITIIRASTSKIDDDSVSNKELCATLYVVGSAVGHLDSVFSSAQGISDEDVQVILLCFQKVVCLLEAKCKEGSNFPMYPRSDQAQIAQVALLRSLMDAVGVAGNLKSFMLKSSTAMSNEWNLLKVKALESMRGVIAWKLKSVHFDDQLMPKLSALKQVAIENLGRATAGLPGVSSTAEVSSGLKAALDSLLDLEGEPSVELQFAVGELLVLLGTHDPSEDFAMNRECKYGDFQENRAAAIFERVVRDYAGGRQPKVRRSATIWLLCMCSAGLPPVPVEAIDDNGDLLPSLSSWRSVLKSPAYAQLVLDVHEFFVTMLNDANEVAKESAVKGLAYLRLRAPSDEMGAQFSDSLFRRLRCFRAFAPSADAAENENEDGVRSTDERVIETSTAPASSSSSSSTIENTAYREVSNVAADVGDPELMYALLYLSTADPIWDSLPSVPSSATVSPHSQANQFSFVVTDKHFRASIVTKAGSLWMTENYSNKTKLVPWLFLLKFHSNSKVAAVMNNLWEFAKGNSALTATAKVEKAALRQNWGLLFHFALARLENARNFKYREASCLALVDLLNGAEADDLREDFLRLWKTASRAVDDVMEAVALAGVKLYRYLGELSLRVATNDSTCRSQLLEFLIEDGIVSKNTICRALSIDVLLRLVKTLKAEDMQDRLASLLLKLLEYLSSLEMPELQYAQFHVEKKDQLERLRVSISQTGPVGQLLELTTTRLKELAGSASCVDVVTELVRGVANLLKFGVGLNTRVGSANFVVTLAAEMGYELRKCNGAEYLLQRVLIPYVGAKTAAENDQYGDEESRYGVVSESNSATDGSVAVTSGLEDGLVIQSYCRAAAYLCPLVDSPIVREYVRSGIFAFNAFNTFNDHSQSNGGSAKTEEGETARPKSLSIYTSRFLLISALATKELVKTIPPTADAGAVVSNDLRNMWYCSHIFPAAFIGQYAATDALKSSWTAVLDELPPTVLYASNSLDAVLHAIAQLLAHPAWDTRRQAARALQAIFASATYRARLSDTQIGTIWQELLDAVPGRLWKGKGVILESLVALAAVKLESKATDDNDTWTQTFSSLLIDESARAWKNQDMPYLESAIENLGKFSSLLPPQKNELRALNVYSLRSAFREWMGVDLLEVPASSEPVKPTLPPLLVKCVFEAIAEMWPTWLDNATDDTHAKTAADFVVWLCASVEAPHLGVWSIRRAIFQTLAAVVGRAPASILLGGYSGVTERVIDCCCGPFGVADGKYWMIRVAAAATLAMLLKRGANHSDIALRLVVQRERFSAAAQTLLASEEAAEQQAAFGIKTQLQQMP